MTAQKQKRIPALRFPEFTGDWEQKKLGDVADIIMGQSPDSQFYNNDGIGHILVQGNADIQDRFVYPRLWTNSPTKLCDIDDLILTVRAPVGFIAKTKYQVCIGRGVCAITAIKSNYDFLYHSLIKYEPEWKKIEQGSTFTAVNGSDIRAVILGFPAYIEQEKIGDFLSLVDERIGLLRERKAALEEYKRGAMQQIFSQQLRFRRPDGTPYPDWQQKKLKEISTPVKRISKTSNEVVMTISAGKGFCMQEDRFNRVIAGNSLKKYTLLKKDELSYNRGASKRSRFGCVYRLRNQDYALIPNVYHSFKIKNDTPAFVEFFLSTLYFEKQLRPIISSSARLDGLLNISEKDFYSIKISLPCLEEQQRIADFLSAIDDKIAFCDTQITENQQFKKALLQQMFV